MRERLRIVIGGAVQGVGFRPFVYRLARELGLDGWVANSPHGVTVEIEGEPAGLQQCLLRLDRDPPPGTVIQSFEPSWLDPVPYAGFAIRTSTEEGDATALVMPDLATCLECRREIFDPADRRYRYPFTTCTHCGPRFSIITSLPYDRPRTSMRGFEMCPTCAREYATSDDRRFHAQPNACPACGPQLALWDAGGRERARGDVALVETAAAVRTGLIAAVKGLGGFQLVVDATNDEAVRRLRARKYRDEKPFALMSRTLDEMRAWCRVSDIEARLLSSAAAPIVLLPRLSEHGGRAAPSTAGQEATPIAPSVAPGQPALGVMLPYTPLHHLLLSEVGCPIVATSGNLSDEPMCIDEREALARIGGIGGIADVFLVHDRPIVRHVDDSILRVVAGRELMLRRARGYAPLPVPLPARPEGAQAIVAVGGHLKNTVALSAGPRVFVSQHIGDLDSPTSVEAFERVLRDLEVLLGIRPTIAAADLHPDYVSALRAAALGLPLVRVQHHHAHVAACLAENELDGPVLGVAWDGTGYGPDGTIWGGEFLVADAGSCSRAACLRPFRLPGGERAVREPRRSALGVLDALFGPGALDAVPALAALFRPDERRVLTDMLARGLNSPVTTSAGRLIDAVSALAGISVRATFEGQAAMALEAAVDPTVHDAYPFAIAERVDRFRPPGGWHPPRLVVDWEPAIRAVAMDRHLGVRPGTMAARFHLMLVEAIVAVACRTGESRVLLTGGCFQNRVLTERAIARLREAGFQPYWHQRVPPNDGGLALGQTVIARARVAAVLGDRADVHAAEDGDTAGRPPGLSGGRIGLDRAVAVAVAHQDA